MDGMENVLKKLMWIKITVECTRRLYKLFIFQLQLVHGPKKKIFHKIFTSVCV
jgi:hypothetical protein